MVDVLVLCTGNAARSVMAGVALSVRRPDLRVETAGTLVVDGQPMSWRTRAAIEAVGLPLPRHASRQATPADLDRAQLIVGLAPEHVEWVRREHTRAAARTATLRRLVRDLPDGTDLATQIAAMALHEVALEPWEEVVDPGGGDAEVFATCAVEVDELVHALAPRLAAG